MARARKPTALHPAAIPPQRGWTLWHAVAAIAGILMLVTRFMLHHKGLLPQRQFQSLKRRYVGQESLPALQNAKADSARGR